MLDHDLSSCSSISVGYHSTMLGEELANSAVYHFAGNSSRPVSTWHLNIERWFGVLAGICVLLIGLISFVLPQYPSCIVRQF